MFEYLFKEFKMDPHQIELSREVLIGNEAYQELPSILDKLNLKGPALLLCDETTFEVAGRGVKDILEKDGYSVEKMICKDVTQEELDRIKGNAGRFRFVLGVGGGRIIDTAKYIGTEEAVPYLSVPTAPSHDGIASSRATINKEDRRYSYKADAPTAIVADVGVIKNAPSELISAGCGDLISNITAVEDWKLGQRDNGEYYSDYAAALSVLSAEMVMSSADLIKNREERGIRNLLKALISAGIAMSIAGSSRPCSGADHQFSHALDYIAEEPDNHGIQCAMGALLSAELRDMEYGKMKEKMMELGIPTTVEEASFTREEAFKAWEEAPDIRDRYTVLDVKTEETESLFKRAGFI